MRPIDAAGEPARARQMELMDAPTTSRETEAPPAAHRWDGLVNWLALLMLLAGSVVWPR
ncbi:MAG TPA: hypothetical protein VLV25_05215 [Steroidobacteraceae bacterium]|nr:hypothetical protein [Steroidobacteraceae bacterium]